jgi:hypothetical protein
LGFGLGKYRIARVLGMAALGVSALAQAQEVPLGVVQQASMAHVRQAAVSQGATIYAGEELSTDVGGLLAVTVGGTGFRLLESSRAFFYQGAGGPVVELRSGTLTFGKEGGSTNVTIVASDVKIVSKGDGPATGQVMMASPCEIRVTSVVGQLDVTSGAEMRTLGERETYSVTPENAVIEVRSVVSPDDPGYHQSHEHKACQQQQNRKPFGSAPVGSGSSHFLKLAGIGAAVVAGILLWPKGHGNDVSPSSP